MTRPLPPILLVDDEKNMRLSLSALLADDGYAVETVESAEQGEQLVDKREFLMLITDAHLGGISGYELLARVRKRRPDLPMLMITAYATPKLAAEAIVVVGGGRCSFGRDVCFRSVDCKEDLDEKGRDDEKWVFWREATFHFR